MNTLNDILEKVKKSGLMIVLGVFSFYFAINAIKGDRGFFISFRRFSGLTGRISSGADALRTPAETVYGAANSHAASKRIKKLFISFPSRLRNIAFYGINQHKYI